MGGPHMASKREMSSERALPDKVESILRLVMDNIPQYVFWKSRDFIYLGCNENFAKVAGLSHPREIVGLSDEQLPWAQEETLRFRADDRRVMESGEARYGIVEYLKDTHGKRLWVETNKIPLRDDEGYIFGVLGTFEDVTAHYQLQEQVRQLQVRLRGQQRYRHLGMMIQGVAHDLSDLLTAVMVHAGRMERHPHHAGLVSAAAQEILDASSAARDLCTQMQAYGGDESQVLVPLRLSAVVTHAEGLIRAMVPTNVQLSISTGEDDALIAGDEVQLQQVLLNLISNTVDGFKGEPGQIRLKVYTHEPEPESPHPVAQSRAMALEIIDSGGPPRAMPREGGLDAFCNLRGAREGLGLKAAREIVSGHRGEILVEPEPTGGAVLRVLLPLLAPATPLPKGVRRHRDFEGCCLLVDDERSIRSTLGAMMQELGFDVLEASDGAEALSLFEAQPDRISVVLLDVSMPGMGGMEALIRMREITARPPVVLMSGYAGQALNTAIFGEQQPVFLGKPFTTTQLLDAVVEAISDQP